MCCDIKITFDIIDRMRYFDDFLYYYFYIHYYRDE